MIYHKFMFSLSVIVLCLILYQRWFLNFMWVVTLDRAILRSNAMHFVSVLILPAGNGGVGMWSSAVSFSLRNVERLAILVDSVLRVVGHWLVRHLMGLCLNHDMVLEVIVDLLLVGHFVFGQFSPNDFFVAVNFKVNILFHADVHVSLELVVGKRLGWYNWLLNLDWYNLYNWHFNLNWLNLKLWHFHFLSTIIHYRLFNLWRFILLKQQFLVIFVCAWYPITLNIIILILIIFQINLDHLSLSCSLEGYCLDLHWVAIDVLGSGRCGIFLVFNDEVLIFLLLCFFRG